jgi:hypothetical protein
MKRGGERVLAEMKPFRGSSIEVVNAPRRVGSDEEIRHRVEDALLITFQLLDATHMLLKLFVETRAVQDARCHPCQTIQKGESVSVVVTGSLRVQHENAQLPLWCSERKSDSAVAVSREKDGTERTVFPSEENDALSALLDEAHEFFIARET